MQVKVDWVRKVYADGRDWHVGNMVQWKEAYYLCFVNGTGHGTADSRIGVCSSTDLGNWTTQFVIGKKTIDPNLLPAGDRLLLYAVKERQDEETEPEFGFASVSIAACD